MFKLLVILFSLSWSIFLFSSTKIIGGMTPDANSSVQKSTVSIMANLFGELRSFCTGTVIGPNIVLTAAHCVAEISTDEIYISNGLNAYEGSYFRVSKFKYFFKDYFKAKWGEGDLGAQDIAILITEKNLEMQPVVIGSPGCLSKDTTLVMAGYGVTSIEIENGDDTSLNSTGLLYYIFGNVFSEQKKSKVTIREIPDHRTASGDSGGPLYEKTENGRLLLHGILSNGAEISGTTEYEILHMSEYTHPFYYLSWMNCALDSSQKIGMPHFNGKGQIKCDGIEFQEVSRLSSFNKLQCEQQLPGFTISEGKYGCMPASEEACKQLSDKLEILMKWDRNLKECSPEPDEESESAF